MAAGYFVFGEVAGAGLSSLLVLRPSGGRFVAGEDIGLTAGEPAFTGEPDGEALGLGATLAVAEGDGLAAGLFGGVSVFGSHAPNMAALAAKNIDKMNDLLIVFLLSNRKHADETPSAAQTPTA